MSEDDLNEWMAIMDDIRAAFLRFNDLMERKPLDVTKLTPDQVARMEAKAQELENIKGLFS